jgi:DNA repair exonuclease SbcCD ATPase subunit
LGLISKSEEGDKLREQARQHEELADLKDREDEIKEGVQRINQELEAVDKWVSTLPLMSDYEVAMSVSKRYNMNITEAKSQLDSFPKQYTIENKSIPEVVKDLKKHRRKLKGDNKLEFTKGIENLIVAYSNHLSDCIKSIYWLAPYETPLRQMRYTENDLKKIHSIKDEGTRRDIM